MAPDWDDFRVFLAVARGESLSAAARVLKRDPATVGRHMARLEAALGQHLFAKSPQGYALSEAGMRLMVHAERAEQAVAEGIDALAGEAAGQLSGQLAGQVRIGATDGCASYVLPQVCAEICSRHPALELQIVALPRVINLSKREADMAISVSRPETGRAAGRITVQKITDYHLHFAASADYLEKHGPIPDLAALKNHRLVGYIQDMISYPELDFLTGLGIERVALASNLVAVQLGFLRHGGGVGVTHDFIMPFAPELRQVLTHEISLTRSFYLLRHAADTRVARLTRLAGELSRGIAREVARLEAIT